VKIALAVIAAIALMLAVLFVMESQGAFDNSNGNSNSSFQINF
jgi:hypothetical protein